MADRVNYYFRQKVSEAELDLAFALLEQADRNLAADLGIYGIIHGAEPVPHAPVPDLSIDLTGPAKAYDHLGQRIFFGTNERIDCAVDVDGIPTEVPLASQERWLGLFLKFDRNLADPRVDGHSQQVFFRQDESYQLIVHQAPTGPIGSASKVAQRPDALLICDVRRRHGQTQLLAADIDTARREAFIFAHGDAVQVRSEAWSVLMPAVNTVQNSFDAVDAALASHIQGDAHRHTARAIDIAPHSFVSATHVEGALHALVDALTSTAQGSSGAHNIGTGAVEGTPHALPTGHVAGQLEQLLTWLNAHLNATTAAHTAEAIAATPHHALTGVHVQAQLEEIVEEVVEGHLNRASDAHAAAAISVVDAEDHLDATNVEDALAETHAVFLGEHFGSTEQNAGQHRTIRQPNLGGTKALLWDSVGIGGAAGHLRVWGDQEAIWFTLNAGWDGAQWVRDSTSVFSGGFRLSRTAVEFLHDDSFTSHFTTWSSTWKLPMSGLVNSSFELTGTVMETGRLGLLWSNPTASDRTLGSGGAVTFRNRFPRAPSSITLATSDADPDFAGVPTIADAIDRDGFPFFSVQTLDSTKSTYWFGIYTAFT